MSYVRKCVRRCGALLPCLLVLAVVFGLGAVEVRADDLIPSTGVNFTALITEATTKLGAIVQAIVAVYIGFLLVRFGMAWVRKIKG